MGQIQLRKYQPGSFIYRVVSAVPIAQPGFLEAVRDIAYELLDVHAARIYHLRGPSACRITTSAQ